MMFVHEPALCTLTAFLVAMGCTSPPSEGAASERSTGESGRLADTASPQDPLGNPDSGTAGEPEGEVLPDGSLRASAEPPGGGFTEPVTVTLSSPTEGATFRVCRAAPEASCTPEPIEGAEVTVDATSVLHVQAELGAALGPQQAWAYFQVDPQLSSFNSDLPLMVMTTPASASAFSGNTPVALSVLDPGGGRVGLRAPPTSTGRARIHIRGSSSASHPKKSYDLELWEADSTRDRDGALLGMPADGDWVLYAPYYWDDALMRNALGYQLSRDMGRYAPRTRFVELFVATEGQPVGPGAYAGVYMLAEEIKRGEDRVDIARLDPEDVTQPDITGGYIFKRDRSGSGDRELYPGEAGGAFDFHTPIVMVDPESTQMAEAQIAYLSAELDQLGQALAASDRRDPTSGRHYSEIIDVESFIDLHIISVLFKNPDAFRLSTYMHKDREGRVVSGPLWDLDRTSGSVDDRAWHPVPWDDTGRADPSAFIFSYGWYGGLFDDPAFREQYWSRWSELLAGPLSLPAIHGWIDVYEAELTEAAARNTSRWDRPELAPEIERLRSWMNTRHAWITACIRDLEDPRYCSG